MEYEFHPLANLFPLLEGPEFGALVDDISVHGLREPVVLHEGKILDGRNRYRACVEAQIEPRFKKWDGHGTPLAFVVSKNLHRRHLNESQRAMIAARLMQTKAGFNQHTVEVEGIHATSRREAAELLNVSESSVTDAGTVLRDGTAEEVSAIEAGAAAASTTAKQIRAKMPVEKRAKKRDEPLSQSGKNPERIQRQQMHADIWAKLSDAIIGLTALPVPRDVVAIVNGNVNRRRVINDRLPRALQYLTEFSDAWNAE